MLYWNDVLTDTVQQPSFAYRESQGCCGVSCIANPVHCTRAPIIAGNTDWYIGKDPRDADKTINGEIAILKLYAATLSGEHGALYCMAGQGRLR